MYEEESLVTPIKSSPLKPILAVVAIAGVAVGGWWLFGRGKGQPEDPARVLIVGPTPELAGFLEREGFDVDHLSVGEAIGQGKTFDSDLDGLPAMLEYADQYGFGYLALNLAQGQRYDYAEIGYEAEEPPAGTTFAVLSVGSLGETVSFGGVVPEVFHDPPAGEKAGLLLAMFGQEEIAKAKTQSAANDLMIRFGSAGTVQDVTDYEKGQENMRRQIAAWNALAEKEAASAVIELARPYERLRGWPLVNGEILLASPRGAWHSSDGRTTQMREGELPVDLSVVSPPELGERIPCKSLPDTLTLPDGFAVAPAGDALLIPSDRYVADLWVLDDRGCDFVKRDSIRRLDGGELGQPRASGRTAASSRGRLTWADLKMRKYRELRVDGITFKDGELHWVSEDIVVIPASLDFHRAATARARRMAMAADPEGALLAELPEIDPATLPEDREALVFVRLPAPKQDDDVQVAVVPVEMLFAGASDVGTVAIREVFPLPLTEPDYVPFVTLVDTPDGSHLVSADLALRQGWANVVATDYDLAANLVDSKEIVDAIAVASNLPHTAHDLAISPKGRLAVWSAPEGEASGGDPLDGFELMALDLTRDGDEPGAITHNTRSDMNPRFVGDSLIVFDTSYEAADDLPRIEALRAMPAP